jgi:hypothetical protein
MLVLKPASCTSGMHVTEGASLKPINGRDVVYTVAGLMQTGSKKLIFQDIKHAQHHVTSIEQ